MNMWKYDVYYDGCWLHEGVEFETEEDAVDDAQSYIEGKIEDWEFEGAEWEMDLFSIETDEQ